MWAGYAVGAAYAIDDFLRLGGVEIEQQKRGGAFGRGGKEHEQGSGLCEGSGGGEGGGVTETINVFLSGFTVGVVVTTILAILIIGR